MAKIKRVEMNSKTVDDVYEEFILSRKVQNFSPATLNFYYWNLKAFRDFLRDNGIDNISHITKKGFEAFALWLIEKYQNSTTINTYLRATRTFLNFAMDEGYIGEFVVKVTKTGQY